MGACFNYETWDGKLTRQQVLSKYKDFVSRLQVEYGTDAYNGTFTTCTGLRIPTATPYHSFDEAYKWVSENAEKWSYALAIKYHDVVEKPKIECTYGGLTKADRGLSGQYVHLLELDETSSNSTVKTCLISHKNDGPGGENKVEVLPADQLTELQKTRLKDVVTEYLEVQKENKKFLVHFNSIMADIKNVDIDIPTASWSLLKKVRKSMAKNKAKRARIANKINELDTKYGAKLRKTDKVNKGEKWFIGGWCAS